MDIYPDKNQKKLLNQVLKACDNNDLQKVKLFMPDINIDTRYHMGIVNAKEIFTQACLSGNLDIVKELLYLPIEHTNSNITFNHAFIRLLEENKKETYHVITYLMNEPILENILRPPGAPYSGLESILRSAFSNAARNGDISLFEVLLNLEHDLDKAPIVLNDIGFLSNIISSNNRVDFVKHFFTHPKLEDKLNPLMLFLLSCNDQAWDIIRFFVFEQKIEKSEAISKVIQEHKYDEAIKMFELRDLNGNLNNDLNQNKEISKKLKI